MLRDETKDEIFINHFYPCIKYEIPADPKLDGTDYFIVAESMQFKRFIYENYFDCNLFFTCENNRKAFYKIIKDCLLPNKIRIFLKACENTKNGSLHP